MIHRTEIRSAIPVHWTLKKIRKIVIANRGEIALRIVRSCRELGIPSVAVYSDADRTSLHVAHADEAYRLGPSAAAESYLRPDLVLEIAKHSGADAIHPGYSFLAENVDFAAACEGAGIRFIGPSTNAMRILGSKISARAIADKAGLPRVPGSVGAVESLADAKRIASKIGYPVLLKAVAGRRGKGMLAVHSRSALEEALETARAEAEQAFGSGAVYVEKLIDRARSIEVQIVADQHGHCVSMGERESSVQRRHQKIIEEAPSPIVDEELRGRMGDAAVRLAEAAGYTNVGTVEFLVDAKRNFYFLEMNPRLSADHPVTEFVTGLDLVHLQIRIAEGEKLPFAQKDIQLRGHAIECRIYAEDPEQDFLPSPGKITRFRQASGPGIREDCGVYEGWTVPLEYDPMISKLIAHASTRDMAIERMLRALCEYHVGGIATNVRLFRRILRDPDFRAAKIDTGYLEPLLAQFRLKAEKGNSERQAFREQAAAIAAALFHQKEGPGSGESHEHTEAGHSLAEEAGTASGWKTTARREGLRT
ncbi:MAG: acetyl/propionyl/methylcrotonyl-CoA carboxylase subunit alpha [Acidobacteriaceae bacterium]